MDRAAAASPSARAQPSPDDHRGHARQGLRRCRRLYHGLRRRLRLRPQLRLGFIFTTALPPAVAAGAAASIRHLKAAASSASGTRPMWPRSAPALRPRASLCSTIRAISSGDGARSRDLQAHQRPPAGGAWHLRAAHQLSTVPKGTERLRVTPAPFHTEADVAHLVRSFDTIWSEEGLPRSMPARVPA